MLRHDSLQKRIFICTLLTVLLVVVIALSIVYASSSKVIRNDALNFLNISMDNIVLQAIWQDERQSAPGLHQ